MPSFLTEWVEGVDIKPSARINPHHFFGQKELRLALMRSGNLEEIVRTSTDRVVRLADRSADEAAYVQDVVGKTPADRSESERRLLQYYKLLGDLPDEAFI